MKGLTVIMPAYNEQASLPAFLPEVLACCREKRWKLIIVNDGSSDATRAILEAHGDDEVLTVLHHKVNRGYGGAIKTGIRAAQSEYVITIDADGQHALEDVQRLYDEIVERDADMVVGSRKGPGAGWYRELGKSLIRFVARRLMPLPIHDINSGMKIYDAALAKRYIALCPDKMAFSDIIGLVFVSQQHLVLECPVRIRERLAGESTISTMTAYETVKEILNMVVLFNPTRVFWPIALVCALAGVVWGVPIILRGRGVSVGAMLSLVTGLIFFFLGLVAEQVSLIRRASVSTPG
jgi:glycosyltransferase involved in cell wall biosynthesis